ncbi:tetratricopeptide repeat protein [bacterium]|nr:tetratricopeptide repeat protein [candidate division CSSED10-310 bacterium]
MIRSTWKNVSVCFAIGMAMVVMSGCTGTMERAEQLIQQGRYDEARKLLEGVITADYQNPDMHVAIGKTYLFLGNHTSALKSFRQAKQFATAETAAKIGKAYWEAGKEMFEKGDLDNTKLYLAGAVREDSELKLPVTEWAEGEWRLNLTNAEKEDTMFNLLAQFWGKETAAVKAAEAEKKAEETGDEALAVIMAERVLDFSEEMDADSLADYYLRISLYYLEKGQADVAATWIEEAYENYSEMEPVLIAVGDYHIATGKLDKALEIFEEAEALNPKSWPVQRGIADVFFYQEKFNKPLRLYEDIIKNAPEIVDAGVYMRFAAVLVAKGKSTQALDMIAKAVELDPTSTAGARENPHFSGLLKNARFLELTEPAKEEAPMDETTAGEENAPA